jgi:hypothetical protein
VGFNQTIAASALAFTLVLHLLVAFRARAKQTPDAVSWGYLSVGYLLLTLEASINGRFQVTATIRLLFQDWSTGVGHGTPQFYGSLAVFCAIALIASVALCSSAKPFSTWPLKLSFFSALSVTAMFLLQLLSWHPADAFLHAQVGGVMVAAWLCLIGAVLAAAAAIFRLRTAW